MRQAENLFRLLSGLTGFLLCAGIFLVEPAFLFSSEIFYSFRAVNGESGGVALIEVSEETGTIGRHITICQDGRLALAKKVRFNKDAERIAVTNEGEEEPFVFLSKIDPPSLTGPADVETLCDEIRPFRKSFIATCDKGLVVLFRGKDGKEDKTFKAGKKLSPPGNRPEDIVILKEKDIAVLSFQKDNSSGTKVGNRIVALSLPYLKLKGDVLIPRDHPELHVEGNFSLSGPGPEVLLVSEETNTVLATLDYYGAVAIFDLDGLINGKLKHYQSIPVSLDGKWGTAFPDRVSSFEVNGRQFALITNAGIEGGTNLVDLKKRKIVHQFDTPSGLEAPLYLPSCMVAVSVCSGKTKYRKGEEIIKEFNPDKKFYIFDFSALNAHCVANPVISKGSASSVTSIEQACSVTSIEPDYSVTSIGVEGKAVIPVALEVSPFVLVASDNRIMVVNATDGTLVEETKSIGILQRFELKE